MAQGVIDRFEIVEINVANSEQFPAAIRPSQRLAHPVGQQRPVGQLGQPVVMGHSLQLLMMALQGGNVGEQRGETAFAPRRRRDRKVPVQRREINLKPDRLAGQGNPSVFFEIRRLRRPVSEVSGLANHRFRLESGQRLIMGIDSSNHIIDRAIRLIEHQIVQRHALAHVIEQRPKPATAVNQRRFDGLAFGDVVNAGKQQVPPVQRYRPGINFDRADVPIRQAVGQNDRTPVPAPGASHLSSNFCRTQRVEIAHVELQ